MYGLIVSLALLLCIFVIERGLDPNEMSILWKLVFYMLLGGIIGSRFYHVLHLHSYYIQDPIRIFYIWHGGLGIFGGIIGALVAFFIVAHLSKLDYLSWLDRFAFIAPLAHSLGRFANVVNRELLPYALYESIALFTIFIFFRYIKKNNLTKGIYSGLYLISYGVIRIVLEPTKLDAWNFGNIYVAQVFAIVFIITGSLLIYGTNKK